MAQRPDWNLRMVRAREACALLPRDGFGAIDWGDITVGHVDTGYTRHPVFGFASPAGSWLRSADGLNLREPGRDPVDPLDYDGSPGHGSRTCSVLCGQATEASAESEIGVAPRLPVVPCRAVDNVVLSSAARQEAVATAIRHVVAKGCAAVSISLGFPGALSGVLGEAVDEAYAAGVIVVAAAGQVVDSVCYPGKFSRAIGVGGVTWQRRIWFDYGHGRKEVDIWAPAQRVLRADAVGGPGGGTTPRFIEGEDPGSFGSFGDSSAGSSAALSGSYGPGDGTSYATVHVAAAAAVWLRLKGDLLAARYPQPWQRVEAFRERLQRTAGAVNGPEVKPNGSGILNMELLCSGDPLPRAADLVMAPLARNQHS